MPPSGVDAIRKAIVGGDGDHLKAALESIMDAAKDMAHGPAVESLKLAARLLNEVRTGGKPEADNAKLDSKTRQQLTALYWQIVEAGERGERLSKATAAPWASVIDSLLDGEARAPREHGRGLEGREPVQVA